MTPGTKLHALLATARIANVPSVVSNLGVGILLGGFAKGFGFDWPWLLTLAAVLFYVGGNFLNDWMDRDWDRVNRPERALPRGLFSEKLYLAVAVSGFVVGLLLTLSYGMPSLAFGLVLVALIWLYTVIHKKTPFSVIPMGMCRACLPVLGYSAVSPLEVSPVAYPSAALLVYITALSMSARGESKADADADGNARWLARMLLVASGFIAAARFFPSAIDGFIVVLAFVPFGIWLGLCLSRYRSPVSAHVSALLAGIPLIDFITLLPLACLYLTMNSSRDPEGFFLISILLPLAAFVAGRALQRLAPAT